MLRTINEKHVTIRKHHKCYGCGIPSSPGEKMKRITQDIDGRPESSYWCEVCTGFMSQLQPWDVEFGFNSDIWEYDGYREYRELILGEAL